MAPGYEKLTTTVVRLSTNPNVHESLRTVIIFSVLVAFWCGLRLYAMRVRGSPMKVEDTLFYVSVVSLSFVAEDNAVAERSIADILFQAAFYGMVVSFFLRKFILKCQPMYRLSNSSLQSFISAVSGIIWTN